MTRAQASAGHTLRIKGDMQPGHMDNLPSAVADLLAAVQELPGTAPVPVTLDGPELAWALERLGFPAGASQMTITYRKDQP